MKLINKITIALLLIVSLSNCADFGDINKDETKLPDIEISHAGAAFAYAQYHGMFIDRYDFELISSVVTNLYVQYFSNVTASFASDRLSAPDRFTRRAWATYYTKALPQIDEVLKMTKDNNPTAHAVALVWKVQIAHRITDLYGAMPYSDANNGQVNVKYDSQQEVYRLMFEDLNAAIEVLSKNKGLSPAFKKVIALSIAASGIFVVLFFIYIVVGQNISNPQYVIPISGMIMGNTMTGVSLGVKTFRESLNGQRAKINALQCFGAAPDNILLPFMRQALETAMLPTLNSMIGMGIVALPGMMTGQILSGTLPTTAILYQIAIMISICTVVTMACFGSLYFGYKTFYSKTEQIINI